jgi:cell division septum initiation protein DivIVA
MLIGILVAVGVAVLVGIGFISHSLERARLERARQVADLSARVRHCSAIGSLLPGQFMSQELATLLLSIEQHLLLQLQKIDRKNPKVDKQLADVRQQLAGGEVTINNAPRKILDEAQAKEVRDMLENLHKLVAQAHRDGVLDKSGMTRWTAQIRQYLTTTVIEMYQNVARTALQDRKPRLAKLQYERALGYLQKLNDPAYSELFAQLRAKLKMAEDMVVQSELRSADGTSELEAGIAQLDKGDDEWKKKAVYDD